MRLPRVTRARAVVAAAVLLAVVVIVFWCSTGGKNSLRSYEQKDSSSNKQASPEECDRRSKRDGKRLWYDDGTKNKKMDGKKRCRTDACKGLIVKGECIRPDDVKRDDAIDKDGKPVTSVDTSLFILKGSALAAQDCGSRGKFYDKDPATGKWKCYKSEWCTKKGGKVGTDGYCSTTPTDGPVVRSPLQKFLSECIKRTPKPTVAACTKEWKTGSVVANPATGSTGSDGIGKFLDKPVQLVSKPRVSCANVAATVCNSSKGTKLSLTSNNARNPDAKQSDTTYFVISKSGDSDYVINSAVTNTKGRCQFNALSANSACNEVGFWGGGGDNQKWIFEPVGNDVFLIKSKACGKYLSVRDCGDRNPSAYLSDATMGQWTIQTV